MFRKTTFIDWDQYKRKVDFIDTFNFQQSVRRKNLRDLF